MLISVAVRCGNERINVFCDSSVPCSRFCSRLRVKGIVCFLPGLSLSVRRFAASSNRFRIGSDKRCFLREEADAILSISAQKIDSAHSSGIICTLACSQKLLTMARSSSFSDEVLSLIFWMCNAICYSCLAGCAISSDVHLFDYWLRDILHSQQLVVNWNVQFNIEVHYKIKIRSFVVRPRP